jgi:hypothetical protein
VNALAFRVPDEPELLPRSIDPIAPPPLLDER